MLSVVIPSYHNAQCLELTLRSLTDQKLPSDRFEVVVVYDGCPVAPLTGELRSAITFPFTEIRLPARGGRSAARNRGILAARGERVLFLDNDSLCPPDLLLRHYEIGLDRPGSVVMGGRGELAALGWNALERVISTGVPPTATPAEHDVRAGEIREPWLYGFSHNLAVRRALAIEAGLFDEGFGTRWGGEDLDFSYRLYLHLDRDASAFVYEPTIRCWHLPHYRDVRRTYADHLDSLAHLRDKHRHFEVELISGLPEVLVGSLADIAERVAAYRETMEVCRRENLCAVAGWAPVLREVLTAGPGEHADGRGPARPAACVGYGTERLAVPDLITFDYGRAVTADNLHLIGVDVPFPTGGLRAMASVDFWRLLRLPDLLAFIGEASRAADVLYLACSDRLTERGRGLGLDPLTDLGYFRELLHPMFRVTERDVPGAGVLLRVEPAAPGARPERLTGNPATA